MGFVKALRESLFVSVLLFRRVGEICAAYRFFLVLAILIAAPLGYLRWRVFGGVVQSLASDNPEGSGVQVALLLAVLAFWFIVSMVTEKFSHLVDKKTNEHYMPLMAEIRLRLELPSFQSVSRDSDPLALAEEGEFWLRLIIPWLVSLAGLGLTLLLGGAIVVGHVPMVGVFMAAAFLLVLWIEVYVAVRISLKERELQPLLAETTVTKRHFQYKEAMRALLCFGMGESLIGHLKKLAGRIYGPQRALMVRFIPLHCVSIMVLILAYAFSFRELRLAALDGMQIGQVSFLAVTLITLGMTLKQIVDVMSRLVQGADKVANLMRYIEKIGSEEPASEVTAGFDMNGPPGIEVTNLTFGYTEGKPVFQDLSFSIEGGGVHYLIGRNGVGKSTFFALLNRLYDCREGMINVGGVDVMTADKSELREYARQLPQGTWALRYTVRECFQFIAGADHEAPEELMWKALRMATLEEKVRQFNQGLDEPLAVYHKATVDLSGGQQKKLNIAMFFFSVLVGKTRVVILDEPFIGIDPESASDIMREFRELPCTILISMHEVERIPSEGKVTFLWREGNRVEVFQGVHAELLETVPQYRKYAAKDTPAPAATVLRA